VVESGFAGLPGPDDDNQKHFDGHQRGWELELGELRTYLARRTHTSAER
jgi:hypothetical protein